jgi:hypothetical protein
MFLPCIVSASPLLLSEIDLTLIPLGAFKVRTLLLLIWSLISAGKESAGISLPKSDTP